jgi:hypothetical protein
MLGRQIDLVAGAVQPEPHRLLSRAAIDVIEDHDLAARHHDHLLPTRGSRQMCVRMIEAQEHTKPGPLTKDSLT